MQSAPYWRGLDFALRFCRGSGTVGLDSGSVIHNCVSLSGSSALAAFARSQGFLFLTLRISDPCLHLKRVFGARLALRIRIRQPFGQLGQLNAKE